MLLVKEEISNYSPKSIKAISYCIECNEDIYAGDRYVTIKSEDVCINCINSVEKIDLLGWFGVNVTIAC